MKTIIAIDFDGTLFTNEYPNVGKPIWEVINKCKELKAKGYCLILWTCRVGEALEEAKKALHKVGLDFEYINENPKPMQEIFGNDCRKIGANYYVDDKNLSLKNFINKKF